jgi:hypothetical protein
MLERRQFGGGGGRLELGGDVQLRSGCGDGSSVDGVGDFGILRTRSGWRASERTSAQSDLLVAWIPTR